MEKKKHLLSESEVGSRCTDKIGVTHTYWACYYAAGFSVISNQAQRYSSVSNPPEMQPLKLYISTCSGKLFFSVRDSLQHLAEYFKVEDKVQLAPHVSVESEGVLSEPGQSDSCFVFLSFWFVFVVTMPAFLYT